MRLIDADALMATLGITDMDCEKCAWRDREWNNCKRGGDFEDACCAIENAPTIEPQRQSGRKVYQAGYAEGYKAGRKERKTGAWIREEKHYKDLEQEYYYYEEHCSVCGARRKIGWTEANYCPNCGARMEGEEQS